MSYRIIVTGSRSWSDVESVRAALVRAARGRTDVTVVDGAATGVDHVAYCVANEMGWATERYPATWADHGKAAGSLRNANMVALGADLCVAFPGSKSVGTWDCVRRAVRAGIAVWIPSQRGGGRE